MPNDLKPSDKFLDFWLATWSVWRSGKLDFFLPSLKASAQARFEAFGADRKAYPGKALPMIRNCFASYAPLDGEYLIGTISVSLEELSMLITNVRVWIYDTVEKQLDCFWFTDIARYRLVQYPDSIAITVDFADGTTRVFRNSNFCKDGPFSRLLEHLHSTGLPPCPSPAEIRAEREQSRDDKGPQEIVQARERGTIIICGLIGLVIGSILGAVANNKGLIEALAIMGSLFGYAAGLCLNWIRRHGD